jgi:hypothetical protein
LGSGTSAHSAGILAERDITPAVQAVLDPPVPPDQLEQLCGASSLAAQASDSEDHFSLQLLTNAAFALQPEHLPAAGPVWIQVLGQPSRRDKGAFLTPPMSLVDLRGPVAAGGSACTLEGGKGRPEARRRRPGCQPRGSAGFPLPAPRNRHPPQRSWCKHRDA